jgi:hypothetical protein
VKRLTVLLCCLIDQLSSEHSLCADRDKDYILSRCKHEGLSFLTITLPEFGAAIERCIESGFAHASDFPSFGKLRGRCLPKFLSGFTSKMFADNGELRSDFDPDLLFAVRSIVYLCKKLKLPCTPERERKAIASYLSNEEVLFHARTNIVSRQDYFLDGVSTVLFDVFSDVDSEHLDCDHGPGVTADRLSTNSRRRIRQWPDRSESVFPSDVYCIPNYGFYDALGQVDFLSIKDEPPVRVVFVPKTLKSPRVIAIEPSHMQYMQQGVLRYMVDKMESHPLTRKSLHFADQTINRDAAQASSVSRDYCTIDMKDASDLVSLALVQRIFRASPLLDLLEASRSLHASLPDGTSVLLQKFASMGSATCFPVEAFVFYTLIQAAVHEQLDLTPSNKSVKNISRFIHVYGDDIIIPVGWLRNVVAKLESYYLRVNQHKSFSRSQFRESCGGDFYNGYSVKPVYLREVVPDSNVHWTPESIMSLAKASDQFYCLGLWSVARTLRSWVETAVRTTVPISSYETDGLTFYSCWYDVYHRWNKKLCRYERKTRRFVPSRRRDDISKDDIASTTMALKNIGNEVPICLSTSVKSRSFTRKTGWSR